MHVTIITGGSQGDVQPLAALGVGLQHAGFSVRFATHPMFEDFVSQHGMEFFSLEGNDPRHVMAAEQKRRAVGRRLGALVRIFRRTGPAPAELRPIEEACRQTDAVIYSALSGLSNLASHVIERQRLMSLAAYLYPVAPTRAFPSPYAPPGWHFGRGYNLLTHVAARQLFILADRSWVNRWRVEALQLPALSLRNFSRVDKSGRVPHLHCYSPAVVPKPADWKEWQHVTGYWFLDGAQEWMPPAGLREFLENDEPPIYIGFGSMVDPRPDELSRIITEALALTGKRAVIGQGWGGTRCELPNVYHVGWVPFSWLLRRVTLAVHHAGTGTAAEVLRAGTPSVAVPFFGEQRFWAARLHDLGVAPQPRPRARLTALNLAEAINEAAADASLRERAATLGERIRSEDGVGRAVEIIVRHLKGQPETAWTKRTAGSLRTVPTAKA